MNDTFVNLNKELIEDKDYQLVQEKKRLINLKVNLSLDVTIDADITIAIHAIDDAISTLGDEYCKWQNYYKKK